MTCVCSGMAPRMSLHGQDVLRRAMYHIRYIARTWLGASWDVGVGWVLLSTEVRISSWGRAYVWVFVGGWVGGVR